MQRPVCCRKSSIISSSSNLDLEVAGADPEEPSGRGDAAQVAYLQEENGRIAYIPGGAPAARLASRGGGGTHPSPPPVDPRLIGLTGVGQFHIQARSIFSGF